MSSTRKDARWQVAMILAELDGREYEDYGYSTWQELLEAADQFLDLAQPSTEIRLAELYISPNDRNNNE